MIFLRKTQVRSNSKFSGVSLSHDLCARPHVHCAQLRGNVPCRLGLLVYLAWSILLWLQIRTLLMICFLLISNINKKHQFSQFKDTLTVGLQPMGEAYKTSVLYVCYD